MKYINAYILFCLTSLVFACDQDTRTYQDSSISLLETENTSNSEVNTTLSLTVEEDIAAVPKESLKKYLRSLSSRWAGRALKPEEAALLEEKGADAIPEIIKPWVDDRFFAQSIRIMIETLLEINGKSSNINYDLAGNLAEYVTENDLPTSALLTADYCVSDNGDLTNCDTGAPYTAGVITTRGFMRKNAGRLNLHRAAVLFKTFLCRDIPMEEGIVSKAEMTSLRLAFQILSEEEAAKKVDESFGNGLVCYSCHSQFAHTTQPFVKFNKDGLWIEDASGQQDPNKELGIGFNNLYTSHFENPLRSRDESTVIMGQDAENLADVGKLMVTNPLYKSCMAKNAVTYGLDLIGDQSVQLDYKIVDQIANSLTEESTFKDVFINTFSNPYVILTAVSKWR